MKKQILALTLGFISITMFAQKTELRLASKAIKKEQFAEAVTAIDAAEKLLSNMKDKQKAEFYFLKGQAYAGNKEYKIAAESFNYLMDFEKQIGKEKYSDDAKPILNQMISEVSSRGAKLYNEDKDYANATKDFYLTYVLKPTDTTFLYNAALSATLAKDYETSLKYYRDLQKMNYTGISVQYFATNKETGKVENLGSKDQRSIMIKTKQYIKPENRMSDSKEAAIIKNIGYILVQQGKTEEAIVAIQQARQNDPKDLNLLLTEADLYIKLEKMDKFGELMNEAVKLDPNNPTLFFNLGVVNANQGKIEDAVGFYKKAIELKPEYSDAYRNLAIAILSEENAIVEEMNKNISDFDKYDELLLKQKNVYKKALPYLEKSDAMKEDIQTVQTLLNIYQILEMDDKAKTYKAKYDKLKGN